MSVDNEFEELVYNLKNAEQYLGCELEEKVRICVGVATNIILCPDNDLRIALQEKFSKWIDTTDVDAKTKKLFKRFLVLRVQELIDLIMDTNIDENMKAILYNDIKVFKLEPLN